MFVDLERRGGSLIDLDRVLRGEPFALASITVSELLVGDLRSSILERRKQRLDFVENVVQHVPVIPFETEAAHIHARLIVDLSAEGLSIGHNDAIIAATALAHGYVLVTHNLRHFGRVSGLMLEEASL
ncbi:MAG: PIN domain-containing protein [Thermomicrobiales bacterium]